MSACYLNSFTAESLKDNEALVGQCFVIHNNNKVKRQLFFNNSLDSLILEVFHRGL